MTAFKIKASDIVNGSKHNTMHHASMLPADAPLPTTTRLVKTASLETRKLTLASNDIDPVPFKLMNYFAGLSLLMLIITSFLPLSQDMDSTLAISAVLPEWIYILMLLALCSHLAGVQKKLSQGLLCFLLGGLFYTLHQQCVTLISSAPMFAHASAIDVIRIGLQTFGIGFYLFMFSAWLVIVAMLNDHYQENPWFEQ